MQRNNAVTPSNLERFLFRLSISLGGLYIILDIYISYLYFTRDRIFLGRLNLDLGSENDIFQHAPTLKLTLLLTHSFFYSIYSFNHYLRWSPNTFHFDIFLDIRVHVVLVEQNK